MLSRGNILRTFETKGLPKNSITLNYLPNHDLINQLTGRFGIEFGVIFTIEKPYYELLIGKKSSISVPIGPDKLLLKHSHPGGTPLPSIYDIIWLKTVQQLGSPQTQSLILPLGGEKRAFNINSPYIK